MAGRRVAAPEAAPAGTRTSGSKAGWIILFAVLVFIIGGAGLLCAYANQYGRVFPGVSLGEQNLSGLTEEQLRSRLTTDELLSEVVTVTADGEELGRYTQKEQIGRAHV